MSGLLFLTNEDFGITKGTKGPILSNNIKGLSLILFYSTQCNYCQNFIPIFKRLPGTINGCQFGMINVSQNRQTTELSKQTVAPITYVPYIILYVNGKPYMRYDGPQDINEIKRFVVEVANTIQNREKFVSNEKIKENKKGIPSYSIGIPYCEDGVCYLEFDEAYQK
jgi:thiol-disulfide isomerase/thioredoxin